MVQIEQRQTCANEAFDLLRWGLDSHRAARPPEHPAPFVDKYHSAAQFFALAADAFGRCLLTATTELDRRRWLAWQQFGRAMHHANRADAAYRMPGGDRESVITATAKALDLLAEALNVMPWGIEPLETRTEWWIAQYSMHAFVYRVKAEQMEASGELRSAAYYYWQSSSSNVQAAALARETTDAAGISRITARSWCGRADALRCEAATKESRERDRTLRQASEAARMAIFMRPGWAVFERALEKITASQQENDRTQSARRSWIQLVITGFLALLTTTISIFAIALKHLAEYLLRHLLP